MDGAGLVAHEQVREGLPGQRYCCGGCEVVDVAERLVRERE
jgi:glycine/serine hydroxymethyltransferase